MRRVNCSGLVQEDDEDLESRFLLGSSTGIALKLFLRARASRICEPQ